MKWKHLPIVAIDTETTGLEPFNGDRVIEFAAVEFHLTEDGGVREQVAHSWLIQPGVPLPRAITEVTGIKDADLAGAPRFEELADEIAALLRDNLVVAHNLHFDRNFLAVEFARLGRHLPLPVAEIDTLTLSQRLFPKASGHKLEEFAQRAEVRLDGAHRAVNDASACGAAFVQLARREAIQDSLEELVAWAAAVGRPPDSSPFTVSEAGLCFRDGPLAGHLIDDHPIELAWMAKQKHRIAAGWQHVHSESTREWIERFLNARGEGIADVNPKAVRPEDWVVSCCLSP